MCPAPPTLFSTARNFLEILYFLSGIGMLIVVAIGLKQLYLAKEQIETTKELFKTQSTRSAFEAAANECRNFSEKLLPLVVKIKNHVKDNNIKLFEDIKILETETGFSVDISAINKEDLKKLAEINETLISYINGIEVFALYFVSGIADDNIAFHTIGQLYVSEVERVAKILPLTGSNQEDCKAIWPLYFRWKKRLVSMQLTKEKDEIEKRLKKNQVAPSRPIGT